MQISTKKTVAFLAAAYFSAPLTALVVRLGSSEQAGGNSTLNTNTAEVIKSNGISPWIPSESLKDSKLPSRNIK